MSILLEADTSKRQTREESLAATSHELLDAMRARLESPHLIREVMAMIAAAGVTGEHVLSLLLYLVATSRLLAKPLAAIVQGPSSSGKSYVLEQVASLIPPEGVLMATDITPNALYYLPPGELEHRFVVAGERARHHGDESSQVTKALREMLSTGQLSKLVTISDGDGPRTERIAQQGPIAFAESTTATDLFEEDANRCLILHPDERPEQTRQILLAAGARLSGQTPPMRAVLREEAHALQRLLDPLDVVIPYGARLAERFPEEPLEVRRAFGHLTSLIQTSALLHQYQRPRDDLGRVLALPQDYWLASLLLEAVFRQTLRQQPADALRRFVARLKSRQVSGEYTAQEVARILAISERTVREYLQKLHERGFIEQTQIPRGPIPARWMIRAELYLADESTRLLPSMEDVCDCEVESLTLPELPSDWPSANPTDVPF
jgi:hypothetical protein